MYDAMFRYLRRSLIANTRNKEHNDIVIVIKTIESFKILIFLIFIYSIVKQQPFALEAG